MLFAMETIEEMAETLRSEDIGKHLAGVEDLLQKHDLTEADINVVAERVKAVNQAAQYFVDTDFPQASGDPEHMTYRPCDPAVIMDRQRQLNDALEQLRTLAAQRRRRLDDSRLMWQFYRDMADAESWIREKEQLMSSPDLGHDLTSIGLLQSKHRANEDELAARHAHLLEELQVGRDLIAAGNFGAPKIAERIADIEGQWRNLQELSDYRRRRIAETVDFYQFFADADDVDTWMLDTLRLVTSDDVGHDEASVQSLVKKHKQICDELDAYRNVLDGLKVQSEALSPQDRESPEVVGRLASIERRYHELLEMAEIRKQRLLDALALYRIYNEADSVDQWITEKEKLLHTMIAKEDIEEIEILKARFDTFDQEMAANKDKVAIVSQLAGQLVSNEHPNSPEVADRERRLRDRWDSLRGVADEKKDVLQLAHDVNTYHIDAQELATWIRDKEKLIESTDELGNDLGGIITLQRRLNGLERDLEAIDARRAALHIEADRLADKKPSEAEAIREKAAAVDKLHDELKNALKVREERLGEASELQKFLQDLDHFQQWLTRTQTAIASDAMPTDVAEAELLLMQHDQLKSDIDAWAPQYAKLKAYGDTVVEGQQDVQYMFLRERLKALDDSWNNLARMWENKRNTLLQNLNLQLFLRDARQAEILLSEQDNFLAKEDIPTTPGAAKHMTPEAAENQIKQLENFIGTMDANNEKVEVNCLAFFFTPCFPAFRCNWTSS
jgi:spectrin beta